MQTNKKPVHIINVPLDLGASRRGTDAGPSAFRIAGLGDAIESLGFKLQPETDIAVPNATADSHISATNTKYKNEILQVCQQLAEAACQSLKAGNFPLIIGGDHSIAMGSISGIAKALKDASDNKEKEDLGVIWFDAHGDMNLPEFSPSGNVHGMPLAHLLGYGDKDLSSILNMKPAIKAENTVLVGIRDIDEQEKQFIRDSGVTAFTMSDIDRLGMEKVTRKALEIATKNTAGFHLSFDLDGCDPEVIPGTGTRVPGGVSYREAHLFLELCAESGNMISMDMVELNPFLDLKNVSAERAVWLVKSALGETIL